MEKLKIEGNHKLSGTIEIGGAKNSAVALIPAAILSDEVTINNVPDISDVRNLKEIISYLGCEFYKEGTKVTINTKKFNNKPITEEYCQKLRASYYFMGAILGRYKKVEMYFPGGCKIGARPIDFHLKAFEQLGAIITNEGNKYLVKAKKLIGTDIILPISSVGATVNILLASVMAEGITTIANAAKEPEVGNLIDFLNSMGAKIEGKDTDKLTITGVKKLTKGQIDTIPDRIEAGTYIILGAMVGDNLKINNLNPKHLTALINTMKKMNINMQVDETSITISKTHNIKPVDVKTEIYPGFPTDLQQPLTSLLALADGTSTIEENIYENRFQNIKYLNIMGANITNQGKKITISGPTTYKGTEVVTTDLRAGACLVLAALAAKGETTIKEVKYILRGYENLVNKLKTVGASISLEYK